MMTTVARGDTYTQVEWVLLESHSQLLNLLLASQHNNSGLIFQRCQRLSALIKRSSIPPSKQLLSLQLQVRDTPGSKIHEQLRSLGFGRKRATILICAFVLGRHVNGSFRSVPVTLSRCKLSASRSCRRPKTKPTTLAPKSGWKSPK